MIQLIIKKFIKDYENISDGNVRSSYVVLSGTIGIICNLLLSITKIAIGLFINSIAVLSDGFNNFTDLGASLAAIVGGKLSNRPPDKEHPNGHGRYEYIATLVVVAMIFVVGFKLLMESYNKLIHPEAVDFSIISMVILILSVSVKVWMWSYNKYIGKKINSNLNMAVATDSRNDVMITSFVILIMIVGRFVPFNIDAIGGLIISLFILYAGFGLCKDAINLLLGAAPDPDLSEKIMQMVTTGKYVISAHKLTVHDYGPCQVMATIHAEVAANVDLAEIHSAMKTLENQIEEELGIFMSIRIQPAKEEVQKLTVVDKTEKAELTRESELRLSVNNR